MNIEDVLSFINSKGVGLDSNIEEDDGEIRISIRDGVHDEPPQSVYIEARETIQAIRDKFGDVVKIRSEVIDEWIDITVKLKTA